MACIRSLLVASALALSIASGAGAQSDSGASKPKSDQSGATSAGGKQSAEPGVLAGPTVEQEAQQGANNPMTAPNNVGRRRANDQVTPMRQWMEAIRGSDLTEQQQQDIAAIVTEFQTAQREFQATHGEQMRQLQQQVRAARESGREPDPKAREQFQQLEAATPKQADYQQRIWEKLTPEQQTTARTILTEMEKRMVEQRRRAAGARPQANAPQPARGRNDAKPAADSKDSMVEPSNPGQGGDDMMMDPAKTDAPKADQSPAAPLRERAAAAAAAARRRGDGAGMDPNALDRASQRRVRFLLSHLSSSSAGNAPTNEERTFKFKEDEGS